LMKIVIVILAKIFQELILGTYLLQMKYWG
jgi:hypothetical protein